MGDNSKIEWTDASWNCVTGCTKVSPGCDHCYAETFAERWRGTPGHHFEQGFDVKLWPDRLEIPLRWKRPRRVFVNSMSDLFHEAIPDGFIGSVFDIMAQTPWHTYQILTKRHGRMRSLLRKWEAASWMWRRHDGLWCGPVNGPLPNVWIGVSAENDKWFDIRSEALLDTPATLRFISAEPLLGPIHMQSQLIEARGGIGWVICGGESGPGARPCELVWIEDIVNACHEAEVPVFVKQFGTVLGREFGAGPKGGDIDRWPAYLQHRHFPRTHEAVLT